MFALDGLIIAQKFYNVFLVSRIHLLHFRTLFCNIVIIYKIIVSKLCILHKVRRFPAFLKTGLPSRRNLAFCGQRVYNTSWKSPTGSLPAAIQIDCYILFRRCWIVNFQQLDAMLRKPRPDELPMALESFPTGTQIKIREHYLQQAHRIQEILPDSGFSFFINPHGRLNDMAAHGHEYYEAMYVLSGRISHQIDGQRIDLPAGSLLLMHPSVTHKVFPCSMEDIAVSITMGDHLLLPRFMSTIGRLPTIGPLFSDAPARPWLKIEFGTDSLCHSYGQQLLCSFFDPDSHSDITTELLLLLFLTEADRAAQPEVIHSDQGIHSDINRIARYIQLHYAEITAADVAREFGYTENYITRALKKHYGMGFVRYRNRQCLMAATGLLINTQRSIAQIAAEVDIPSVSHFYKLFVEEYRMTPTEYRSRFTKEVLRVESRLLP